MIKLNDNHIIPTDTEIHYFSQPSCFLSQNLKIDSRLMSITNLWLFFKIYFNYDLFNCVIYRYTFGITYFYTSLFVELIIFFLIVFLAVLMMIIITISIYPSDSYNNVQAFVCLFHQFEFKFKYKFKFILLTLYKFNKNMSYLLI